MQFNCRNGGNQNANPYAPSRNRIFPFTTNYWRPKIRPTDTGDIPSIEINVVAGRQVGTVPKTCEVIAPLHSLAGRGYPSLDREGGHSNMTNFHPDHLIDLRKSGLSDETIKQANIQTVPPDQINKRLGFNISGLSSMYEITYPGCEEFFRYRCFYAEGKTSPKYLQRKDSGNHLYIPPLVASILSDPAKPLYFTEGEKKSLKASQEGLLCIGLSGLWNWKEKGKGLISNFDQINFKSRKVFIVPDNDYKSANKHGYGKNLEQAVNQLTTALIERGATVSIIELPDGPEKGLDDFLCSHSVAEFHELPDKEVRTSSIEEMIEAATTDNLDEVLQRVAQIHSYVKQEAFINEIYKKLKVPRSSIKKDLKKYRAKYESGETNKNGKKMIAIFPNLVDLVDDDGNVAFLIRDDGGVHIAATEEIDGVEYFPPAKEHLPFLLPRAERCLKYYGTDDNSLFDDLLKYYKKYSFLPDEQWLVVALYTFQTYLQDHPDIHYQAMLLFHAVPERGKSRTGKAIANVAYRGVHLVDMREANIFRYSGNLAATLFFDIMNLWKKVEKNGSEDVLLLRYEKGAKVSRVLYPEKGAFEDTVYYEIHGPTIMASNEPVHKILGSRCIAYTMPNAPGNYEDPTPELGQNIKERLVAWRAKAMDALLTDIKPIDGITGRLWDITKPLFQICSVVCPVRYKALLGVIRNIAGERVQEKKESVDGLLIQVIYEMTQADADHFDISTADVTAKFNELWQGDKPKSKEWTGRKLKTLGIPTDTKSRFSMIHLDRKTLETILSQYGFISQGGEITSKTSNTLQDTKNTFDLVFEVPFEDNIEQKNLERTSKDNILIKTNSCKDVEDIEVISGGGLKSSKYLNLKEIRI